MTRHAKQLSAISLARKAPGLHGDGQGLYLQVKAGKDGQIWRSWVFRYMRSGRARTMGLGAFPDVQLSEAREAATACRRLLRDGADPIAERRMRRQDDLIADARAQTFRACAESYIAGHKAGWKNAKHAAQWSATLATYAYPIFGALPVQEVDTGLVSKALDPIWHIKPETASRLRQRIEAVLDWATVREYRTGENPARWNGHLEKVLPHRSKVRAVKHHAALPYADLPAFWRDLSAKETLSAKALAFTVLTAARSGETRGAAWAEIDLDQAIWTVPGERTKSGRLHRVPLTAPALALLRSLTHLSDSPVDLVFPNPQFRPLSDTAMRKYLQDDMGKSGLTVHGFRSTFRDWAAERTTFPRELAEASLAHTLKDKTEAAYQRGDLLSRRRALMDAWAAFCLHGEAAGDNVVPYTAPSVA
jgi:integrase